MDLKLTDPGNDRSRAYSLHSGRSIGPRRWRWSGRDEQRTVVKRNSYAPFGETFAPTVIDGTGYTGHVMDQATGLTYMQQRYYDPQIGRFLSNDPVSTDPNTGASFNRYNYANNSPYKFTDPDGRSARPDPPHERITTEHRTQNANGSVTVERVTSASDTAPPPPTGGVVVLLPQRTAGGAPASTGDKVMGRLLNLSEKAGSTVEVTSGQRTPEQNASIPGSAPRSQHLQDNAADIRISGNTPTQTADAANQSGEFNRVNEYSNGRGVHVDLKSDGTQGKFYDWRPVDNE